MNTRNPLEELFARLGGGNKHNEPPVDVSGNDYGCLVVRSQGMDGYNQMARRAVGKSREEVLQEFGTSSRNQEVYDYVDTCVETQQEPNPAGFRAFLAKRQKDNIAENIRYLLGAFVEGGPFDPERSGFNGEPLKNNNQYAEFLSEFTAEVRDTAGRLDRSIEQYESMKAQASIEQMPPESAHNEEPDPGILILGL